MALSEDGSADPSYYAILNVARDASYEVGRSASICEHLRVSCCSTTYALPQDIKKAYKGLAQVFHPDKHQDDELRDKAQEAFAKLQEAYEVCATHAGHYYSSCSSATQLQQSTSCPERVHLVACTCSETAAGTFSGCSSQEQVQAR